MRWSAGCAHIPAGAFRFCEELEEIEIPEGVESIGEYAFWNCRRLTRLHLPDSLREIGRQAFFGCGSCTVEIGPNTSRGGWEKDVQTVACRAAR